MEWKLVTQNGKKNSLFIEGEFYCKCYPGDLKGFGLSEGKEISETQLQKLTQEILLPRAKKRALYLVGKKRYTKKEMERKLQGDGYPSSVISDAVTYLQQFHYIADESYAEDYASELLKKYSPKVAIYKMQAKGLDRQLIEEAIEHFRTVYDEEHADEVNEKPEYEAIRSFLRRKGFRLEDADAEQKNKMVVALYRKGFSLTDIRTVLACEDVDFTGEE